MTKSTRRILFYVALIVFISVGYVAVLYAQGYKYDFDEGEFLKTGAFYLNANTGAEVYIDDEFSGKTSFLTNSFSKDRLLPGLYSVRVQKQGYSTWQKSIGIDEGLVTDFPNVILLPLEGEDYGDLVNEIDTIFLPVVTPTSTPTVSKKSPQPTPTPSSKPEPYQILNKTLVDNASESARILAANVVGFSISENKNKLIWWDDRQIWVMYLKDQNYQPYVKSGERELVIRLSKPVKNATWFRDNNHVVVDVGEIRTAGSTLKHEYQIIELDKRGGQNIIKI